MIMYDKNYQKFKIMLLKDFLFHPIIKSFSNNWFNIKLALILLCLITPKTSKAQVTPDSTLPNNSLMRREGNQIIIEGGTIKSENLFHSFKNFSVTESETILFNNSVKIQNIFSRVTGANQSKLNGLIRANGTANLFLINPNGIFFGANAALNIGGSFIGTTANHLKFEDGNLYSATWPERSILSNQEPIALQFQSSPGLIKVQNEGHNLIANPLGFSPIIRSPHPRGLSVQSKQNLALIGGEVIFEGGIVTGQGIQIEIGSIEQGEVRFSKSASGLSFDYQNVSTYNKIHLLKRALIDSQNFNFGQTFLKGSNLLITDGSVIAIAHLGQNTGGLLNLDFSHSINISGVSSDTTVRSGVIYETVGVGNGGLIVVSTPKLSIRGGGAISGVTYSEGQGSSVWVNASEIEVSGFSPALNTSLIGSTNFGTGKGGNVVIRGEKLSLNQAGNVGVTTFNIGDTGQIIIDVDFIEVTGFLPDISLPSGIYATSLNAGKAGEITINSEEILLTKGGRINSSTSGSGDAGDIFIKADNLQLQGLGEIDNLTSTQITSSADILSEQIRDFFQLPDIPSGQAGNVIIDSSHLTMTDGGLITTRNDGLGNGGVIDVKAFSIVLDNSSISASTQLGDGGNINLLGNNLSFLNSSNISAKAGGIGNGGNLSFSSDLLLVLENSQITAEAMEGKGGNIDIQSQIALLSGDSEISASSRLGIDGEINIEAEIFQVEDLTTLPLKFSSTSLLANSCLTQETENLARFTQLGSGGLQQRNQINSFLIPLSDTNTSKGSYVRLPKGRQLARELVKTKDGWKLIGTPNSQYASSVAEACQL